MKYVTAIWMAIWLIFGAANANAEANQSPHPEVIDLMRDPLHQQFQAPNKTEPTHSTSGFDNPFLEGELQNLDTNVGRCKPPLNELDCLSETVTR